LGENGQSGIIPGCPRGKGLVVLQKGKKQTTEGRRKSSRGKNFNKGKREILELKKGLEALTG